MSPDRQDDLIATVDEIEEGASGERLAVLVFDDGQKLVVPLERLPDGTRDGSVLRVRFRLDRRTERERRNEVRDLQRRLFGPEE
ncbi:DUF3006 domain-containing protein [Sphaerobacter thermophilus]|uniref:DUF3006 domain-containing protein n=1 Tax=Sphaerobacter thermophilus TaxID=2057 RepID=UPI000DB0BA4D|nr:MAG: hypothetical protein DIU58_02075 [Sphaerobacter thermophilus]